MNKKRIAKMLLSSALCFGTSIGTIVPAASTMTFAAEVENDAIARTEDDFILLQGLKEISLTGGLENISLVPSEDLKPSLSGEGTGKSNGVNGMWVGLLVKAPEGYEGNIDYHIKNGDQEEEDFTDQPLDKDASGNLGLAIYIDVSNKETAYWGNYYTITWKDKEGQKSNLTETLRFVPQYKMVEPPENIDAAISEDALAEYLTVGEAQLRQYGGCQDSNEKVNLFYELKFAACDLDQHHAGDENHTLGYWFGFNLKAEDGVTYESYKLGETSDQIVAASDVEYTSFKEKEDKTSPTFYFNVDPATLKVTHPWVGVKSSKGIEYYHVSFIEDGDLPEFQNSFVDYYRINKKITGNGSINLTPDQRFYKKNSKVSFTVDPEDGNYVVEDSIKVTDSTGEEVELTPTDDGDSFEVPEKDVTISVSFAEDESKTPDTPVVGPTTPSTPSTSTTPSTGNTDSTVTNPDGSKTTTTTNPDGSTTEKTEYTDGSSIEKTEKDGVTTEVYKDENGDTVSTTVTQPDGSFKTEAVEEDGTKHTIEADKDKNVTTTTVDPDETVTEVKTDANGNISSAKAEISSKSVEKAAENAAPVKLNIQSIPADQKDESVAIDITLPENASATEISIPVENGNPGSVAMMEVDGKLTPIPESMVDEQGNLIVPLQGSARIVIKDNSKDFPDMPNLNKTTYPGSGIAYLSSREIMNGSGNGNFEPLAKVSRGTIARMLYNLEGSPSVAGQSVPEGVEQDWYKDAATWAANTGLMAKGSTFRGDDLLTREQLAMVLWRYTGNPAPKGDLSSYSAEDQASISSEEMKKAISWAVGEKIMGQGSPINGQKDGSRQEIANMLYRFLTKVR